MYSLPVLNLEQFEQEISDNEQSSQQQKLLARLLDLDQVWKMLEIPKILNLTRSQIPSNTKKPKILPFKLKSHLNPIVLKLQPFFNEYILKQSLVSWVKYPLPKRKSSKKTIYFDKCQIFRNLQLESSFTTLKQVINRCELQFSQKSHLLSFLDTHQQLKRFLHNSLSNGYEDNMLFSCQKIEKYRNQTFPKTLKVFKGPRQTLQEINNDFIYFIFDLIQELKTIIFKSSDKNQDSKSSVQTALKEKEKESSNRLQKEKLMKKQLDEVSFFQRIFYQQRIKYLNCQQISTPVSDERVKQAFVKFARLYSHLIIKLIIMDLPALETRKSLISCKRMSSCEEKLFEMWKQSQEVKNKNSCEIFGNWFLNTGVAKSFNSINYLGSINLNNLNDIKIYSSKHDLWSEDDEEKYYNFSDQELEALDKDQV